MPIGIQTFDKLRDGGYYYVDKTSMLLPLTKKGGYYFLSRPRRFGKSLMLDTLRCLFEGREALFEGLYIHDRWDWQTAHPVIRLSFGSGVIQSREELDRRIHVQLSKNAEWLNLPHTSYQDTPDVFASLIATAHQKYGRHAVILIDEYDKPILDNIRDSERARELREGLKNLYSVIKDADPHLHFVMITGVSKFSKVSLFSGLNNLRDITLSEPYSSICGYTDDDIDRVFAPELDGLDRNEIRRWYNGYRWGGQDVPSVYNPFDVLLLFQERKFSPYWFESATPTFLIDVLKQRGVFTPKLERLQAREQLLSRFDVDDIATEALLFQTGYLTIHAVDEPLTGYWLYTLGFPNREVESSLNQALLPVLGINEQQEHHLHLLQALQLPDLQRLMLKRYPPRRPEWHRLIPTTHQPKGGTGQAVA